jgi:hypothetical protein
MSESACTHRQTDEEKLRDLVDQYRKLQKDPKAILFCPWCSKISKAPEHGLDETACCQVFAVEWNNIGVRQIQSVERQMAAIHAGKMTVINCPYCGTGLKKWTADPTTWIHPNVSPFCCELLHDAILAVAQRQETVRRIELAKRIQDAYV